MFPKTTIPVISILEERCNDDDLAVFLPERLELVCRAQPRDQWGYCFTGFETNWNGPIELEVQGSGDYKIHNHLSTAALSLDFGATGGWSERSLIGLGLLQGWRPPHAPSWGAGWNGQKIVRGNLLNAGPEKQKIVVTPSDYAPEDWDGRLWIGLLLHNTGASTTLKARITNALPKSGNLADSDPDEEYLWTAMREHQIAYIKPAVKELLRYESRLRLPDTSREVKFYAQEIIDNAPRPVAIRKIEAALAQAKQGPIPAAFFMEAVSSLLKADTDDDRPEAIAQLNRLYETWHETGAFGKELGCIIRTATNLDKIALRDCGTGEVLAAPAAAIRLSAARHEYEGFQIILTPLPDSVSKLKLAVSDLRSGDSVIPSTNITVNPVGYTRVLQHQGDGILCPDPLLIGDIPDLSCGEHQPVWITVYVPENALPGLYEGTVTLSSPERDAVAQVPIEIRVRNFNIPKRISLRTSFWMFREQLNRFYHLDEIPLDDYMKWIDFALQHRLCPIDAEEGACIPMIDLVLAEKTSDGLDMLRANPSPFFGKWDTYLDHLISGGASTIHLAPSQHFGTWYATQQNPVGSEEQLRQVVDALRVLREHCRERGLFDMHYLQLRDEASTPDSLAVYRRVREELPDLKLLLTWPLGEAVSLIDIPCPITSGFTEPWRDETKANGGEFWWYVAWIPQGEYANLFIEQTGPQNRALFWQTWKYKVDGLLYWGLNYWLLPGYTWPENAKGPSERLPEKGFPDFCPLRDSPGDGFSMYPGPTPSQPMSSIRLEIMRDGEEDYEYLLLLDQLIAREESKGVGGPALENARAARAAAESMIKSLTEYEQSGGRYLDVRDEIAEAIEGLIAQE